MVQLCVSRDGEYVFVPSHRRVEMVQVHTGLVQASLKVRRSSARGRAGQLTLSLVRPSMACGWVDITLPVGLCEHPSWAVVNSNLSIYICTHHQTGLYVRHTEVNSRSRLRRANFEAGAVRAILRARQTPSHTVFRLKGKVMPIFTK